MSESKWPRIKWNQACSELANRPFIDLFKESDSMKNDPTSSAVMDYELMCQRAEAAEARAAQLETDNDEMQSYINEIRVALHTEKDELTIDAVRRVISERDELRAKLEQAQRQIEELETTLKDIATAPYENQPNDGDEWEKEYYLRGMHRP